jgi:hypothetical protein
MIFKRRGETWNMNKNLHHTHKKRTISTKWLYSKRILMEKEPIQVATFIYPLRIHNWISTKKDWNSFFCRWLLQLQFFKDDSLQKTYSIFHWIVKRNVKLFDQWTSDSRFQVGRKFKLEIWFYPEVQKLFPNEKSILFCFCVSSST